MPVHTTNHNVRLCQRSKTYKTVYEWVNAIIFATVVASLVHIFIFQMYVIPTSSMEKSLLIGDYLYVSKVTYGPQMPNTPLSFPFVDGLVGLAPLAEAYVVAPHVAVEELRNVEVEDHHQPQQQPEVARPYDEPQRVEQRGESEADPFVTEECLDLSHVLILSYFSRSSIE